VTDCKQTFLKSSPRDGMTLREMYRLPPVYGAAPGGLQWSPDGRTLAFLWNADGDLRQDIYLLGQDDKPRCLTDSAAVGPLPVEDDERPEADIADAERLQRGVTQFAWSPDGRWIAYLCRGDLFRVEIESGRTTRLISSSQERKGLQISDDGRKIAFLSGGNVWTYDLADGTVAQGTFFSRDQVSVTGFCLSPCSKYLAVSVSDRSMLEKVKMPDYTPEKEVKINELRRGNVGKPLEKIRVGIVPVGGGRMNRIALADPAGEDKKGDEGLDTGRSIRLRHMTWTWDSSRLLVSFTSKNYRDFHVYAVTVGREEMPVEIYSETQEPWFDHTPLPVSPDSKYVYFLSYRSGWRHIYRVPVAGGEPEQITRGEFDIAGFAGFWIPRRGDRIFYAAHSPDPCECRIFRVGLGGGESREVSPARPFCDVTASEDGKSLAFVCSSILKPPRLWIARKDAAPREVLSTARPEFEKITQPKIERFRFSNESDGAEIHGQMILPYDFDPAQKYPVVLSCIYAGQGKNAFNRYHLLDAYMANEMGYILVHMDLRASTGYGREFFYGYYKKMGIIDAEECVSCAKHLRTLPYVDGERIGLWGGSYGGFLTLMVMCNHPGVFHTGISWKPVTDWRNYNDDYTCQRLTRPTDDPEVYRATSPVFHADGLQGNLLLVHGLQDDNVLFQDCVWMAQKLIEAGKYFDLMIYPRDDHGLTLRPESLPDCMERFAAYFEQRMGRGPGR
jgi:dipeptidyl-peptidase-4